EHDEANQHFRRYARKMLRTTAQAAGWRVERLTSFNSLLFVPAAAVRLAKRRRVPDDDGDDYTPELRIGPAWLNTALERPLQLEARWLGSGRSLPAGLSLLGVMRNPT